MKKRKSTEDRWISPSFLYILHCFCTMFFLEIGNMIILGTRACLVIGGKTAASGRFDNYQTRSNRLHVRIKQAGGS